MQTKRVQMPSMLVFVVLVLAGCNKPPEAPAPLMPLRDVVSLTSADVTRTDDGKTRFLLKFRCLKDVDEHYRVLFHGYVKDPELVPAEKRNPYNFLNADHEFATPTSEWHVGDEVEDEVVLDLKPGEYNFHVGLFDRHNSKALSGGDFELGWKHLPPEAPPKTSP